MNLIVVGASHRSASIPVLERLSRVDGPHTFTGDEVAEAVVLTTCNRTDVYAVVPAFHAGLSRIVESLARATGLRAEELVSSLYVHHGIDAVRHVFRVAAGLESMVAGEPQILGQLRDAYQRASDVDSAGKMLHELMQHALRVGKRAHAETGIDKAPRSLVSTALDLVEGAPKRYLIVGAGAMGALATAELGRRGVTDITMVNRSDRPGVFPISDLSLLLQDADVVVAATASVEPVLTVEMVRAAARPLTIVDLALPRDVEAGVGALPGIRLIDIEHLTAVLPDHSAELHEVERIVDGEVDAYGGWLRGNEIAPTVAALRTKADDVVAAELRRLSQRRPELTEDQRGEVAHALHRVVQRLLHEPTVRVRQLAAQPGGEAYTQMVRDLFDLNPQLSAVAEIPEVRA
ncbi:MAG TPA: glutamyl-tRNA reductase [Micromonosporaceae bacterium]|nr:glutamyl-tRNA reductase [Micromonosporaceae bacterium]